MSTAIYSSWSTLSVTLTPSESSRPIVGQGLRRDLAKLEKDQVRLVVDCLRRRGVDDHVISEAVAEAKARTG